uniref:Uncharacterized protein n=1 Tax=Salix viminalis TaxID=40686 RepID=A0A6N2N9A0_SALVM
MFYLDRAWISFAALELKFAWHVQMYKCLQVQGLDVKASLCSLHCYNAIHEKMQPSIARSMKEIDGFIIRNLVLLQRQHG